ncbi:metabotropic glutamate receptor 2-like isoform X1 [Stylophora pistillata]|uniref:metabotropic glutamate receptor 2-like isoform X1 n=1 Tax=Stylophora pistillata TaxID=50429 RepID=UPI000C048025|nr:metabotropic glutamate receptor 2-like isoform X1 [Stylophora pistillata]
MTGPRILGYAILWQAHLFSKVLVVADNQQLQMDGDVLFGGLFPVHKRSTLSENVCGEIDPQAGFQYLAAMLFALQKINHDTELLPNVTIGAKIFDTCRSQTIGADRAKDFIKHTLLDEPKPLVGVIGPFTSDVSVAVANLLRVFEIPQISYGSSSVELSNKELYGNFFRTIPPDSFQAQALVDVALHYGWTYVYTINSHGNYGKGGMSIFRQIARKAGICIAKAESLPSLPREENYMSAVQTILRHKIGNAHVIVLFTTQTDSAGLLRAGKESGVKGLTWLGSSGWSNRVDVTEGNEELANGSLTVGHGDGIVNGFLDFLTNLNNSLGGTSYPKTDNLWFEEVVQSVLKCETRGSAPSSLTACKSNLSTSLPRDIELAPVRVVVNAVYALAHALDDMQRDLCPKQTGICQQMKETLKKRSLIGYLKNVTFPDASYNLTLKFNENQEMDGTYSISNFQQREDGSWKYVRVGTWRYLGDLAKDKVSELGIDNSLVSWGNAVTRPPYSYCSDSCTPKQITKPRILNSECCWNCISCQVNEVIINNTCKACDLGYKPNPSLQKCVKLELSHLQWNDPISTSLKVLAGFWVFVAIGTFAFYVIKRHDSVIKAAGRELSFFIFVGIILCYTASFVCLTRPTDFICTLRRFIGSTCFTACYAPLLMKTNRIYRIFIHAKHSAARPSLIRPMSQVIISMGLIAVQLLLTAVWTLSDPPKATVIYHSPLDASLICNVSGISLAVNMSYNILLMFLCTMYAFKTRSFPRNFNEAKHIGITLYITCSLWIIFLPTYFNAETSSWREYVYCSLFIFVGCVSLMGLLLPKVAIVVLAKLPKERVHITDDLSEEKNESTIDFSKRTTTFLSLDPSLPLPGSKERPLNPTRIAQDNEAFVLN